MLKYVEVRCMGDWGLKVCCVRAYWDERESETQSFSPRGVDVHWSVKRNQPQE